MSLCIVMFASVVGEATCTRRVHHDCVNDTRVASTRRRLPTRRRWVSMHNSDDIRHASPWPITAGVLARQLPHDAISSRLLCLSASRHRTGASSCRRVNDTATASCARTCKTMSTKVAPSRIASSTLDILSIVVGSLKQTTRYATIRHSSVASSTVVPDQLRN